MIGAGTSIVTAFLYLDWFESSPALRMFIETAFRLQDVPGTEVLVLALAFSTGVIVEMIILLFMATRTLALKWQGIMSRVFQALIASLVAALTAYATLIFIVDGINQETFLGILLQGGIAGIAGVIGAVLAYYVLGSQELKEIYRSYQTKIFKTDIIAPQD